MPHGSYASSNTGVYILRHAVQLRHRRTRLVELAGTPKHKILAPKDVLGRAPRTLAEAAALLAMCFADMLAFIFLIIFDAPCLQPKESLDTV